MRISDDRVALLTRATGADLEALGLIDQDSPTPEGVVLLVDDGIASACCGMDVSRWALPLAGRCGGEPLETRELGVPCLEWLDAVALEIACDVAPELRQSTIDGITRIAREVLTNAYAHRDYAIDEPIVVDRFVDGATVYSPGRPVGARVVDGAWSGRGTRNPGLAFGMKHLGYGWQQGRGWPTCVRLARDFGVILTVVVEDDGVRVSMEPDVERQLDLAERGESRVRHPSTSRDEMVLDLLSDGAWWKPGDLASRGDIPRSSLSAALKRLESAGRVERSESLPRSPNQCWRSLE